MDAEKNEMQQVRLACFRIPNLPSDPALAGQKVGQTVPEGKIISKIKK
jgi:hypothetical protein